MTSDLAKRALDRAIGQVGQKENPLGSNWGHPVQDYLASVGIFFPASWCMAFMYWCFSDAANQLGIKNPLKKTGGVLDQWNAQMATRIKVESINTAYKAQPGDIMIMDHGHGLGHTGIVETADDDGITFFTIEGNTNDTGSREGIEVARKRRQLIKDGPIIGFIRI